MRLIKYVLPAIPIIIAIMYLIMNNSIKDSIRDILTVNNQNKGIVDKNSIKWCTFPLSHDLDKGGVPFDIQDVTHPSIVYIPNGFNGYDSWAAVTPYPCSLPTSGEPYENTCIFYSNSEGDSFPTEFKSIEKNPIILKAGAQYNSDPDLLYDDELKCLFAITRKRKAKDYITNIVVQKSLDGQHWTEPHSLFLTDTNTLCPCVIKVNGSYRIYTFEVYPNEKKTTKEINIWESPSLDIPSFTLVKTIPWDAPSNFWHGDVYLYKGRYYMVYCGTNNDYKTLLGTDDLAKYMWLAVSDNGYNFRPISQPLLKMNGVYRSSLFVSKDIIIVYFSVHNRYKGDKKQYPYGNRIGLIEFPLKIIDSND